jgi:thiamine-phosphate pyrophosphorylase
VGEVVTAAGKRLGEALRAVEEFLKTLAPGDAAKVEALRYRFYDAERRVALTLRPVAGRFADVRLYVLVTESLCRRPWLEAAEAAVLGGADCLQLREKELEGGELLRRAKQLVALCRRHGVPCVINDRPDVAILSGADGVHLGQNDLPAAEARKLLGRDKLLGVSTHDLGQARQARADGADYIGVGPFFRSTTKPRDFVAGPAYARQVAEALPDLPAVAIAGITAGNVDEVLATGLRAVAVTSAVLAADDVRAAAERLKKKLSANGHDGHG